MVAIALHDNEFQKPNNLLKEEINKSYDGAIIVLSEMTY